MMTTKKEKPEFLKGFGSFGQIVKETTFVPEPPAPTKPLLEFEEAQRKEGEKVFTAPGRMPNRAGKKPFKGVLVEVPPEFLEEIEANCAGSRSGNLMALAMYGLKKAKEAGLAVTAIPTDE